MAIRGAASSPVARLTRDLLATRWRGLDALNVHNSHQDPRDVQELAQLAHEYCVARRVEFGDDRVAEIRFFLHDGIAAYWVRGHKRAAQRFRRLFFAPSESVPPKTPHQVLKEVKAEMELAGEDYAAWRRIAFPQLAAFLIAFVTAAREAAEPQPADIVTYTPPAETPPRSRSGCARLALTGLAGLVIAGVVLARLLMGSMASPHQATTATSAQATIITGIVECSPDPTMPVVGVWIVGSNGGSGWAHFQLLPGHPNIAVFDRTLPKGGSYVVHVGCGGTPAHWELALGSVTPVSDSGYHFTCYDSTADQNPYLGQCRP